MTRPPPPSDRVRRVYLRARLFVLVLGIPQAAIGVYLLAGGISNKDAVITAAGAVMVIVGTLLIAVVWVGVAVAARRPTSPPPLVKRSTELRMTWVNGAVALAGLGVGIVLAVRGDGVSGLFIGGMCVLYLAYRAFVLWDLYRTK